MLTTPTEPRLAYEVSVAPQRPRLLLIMGFGMRGAVWRPQVEGLGADHTLAWFDNRGIGESEAGAAPGRMAALAADALRVADALGWADFHLVGVSLGGMVAQEVALAAPDRVRSLVLIATHPGGPFGLVPTPLGLFHWLLAAFGPARRRVHHLLRLLYPASFLATVDRASLRERMELQVGTPPRRQTALRQLTAVMRHDTRARLSAIRAPTLVVKPESDRLIRPFHSDRLHRGIPGSRLLVVPDAGHGLTFHAANIVNRAIREHVAAHDEPPGASA